MLIFFYLFSVEHSDDVVDESFCVFLSIFVLCVCCC